MSIEVAHSHGVFIRERGSYQLARALKEYCKNYCPQDAFSDSSINAADDVLYGDFITRWGGGELSRILSLPFEGKYYVLKYYIWEEKGMIACHSGETPGVEPIRITAQLIDSLAASQSNERGRE